MKNWQKILAFDTALFGCSVAYCDMASGQQIADVQAMPRGQAEKLVPMIQNVLDQAGVSFSDIEVIGTNRGPGAFTGLRIGLSTARALALALDVPVIGLTSMEILAAQYFAAGETLAADEILCVAVETKRRDFYIQSFGADEQALTAPDAMDIQDIADHLLQNRKVVMIGDALAHFKEQYAGMAGQGIVNMNSGLRYSAGYDLPDPALMARMINQGQGEESPEPLYLRGADVSQPKRKARQLRDF